MPSLSEETASSSVTADDAPPFRGPLAAALPPEWTSMLVSPDRSLPLPPASDRTAWGGAKQAASAAFTRVADAERGTSWPQPLASQAARVHRDGDRKAWEGPAFARQHRLTRAAAMAAMTGDDTWIDEVADGIVLLCEQSSWCWPAHDDSRERHGAILATTTDPFLDLGAGEAVSALAWIDQLLGADLDRRYPGLRARMRREAKQRVIEPFLARRDWHWIGLDGDVHNWNPWIHGNVLVAALRLLDDPADEKVRRDAVALAVEGLDRYVAALPDDGAIDEGYEYWWNGALRALEALDVLAHATADRVQLASSVPALRATVAFPHRMHLGGNWYLNVADGQARPQEPKPWHALARAADRAHDADARSHAFAQRGLGAALADAQAGTGRMLRALADPTWRDAASAASPLPKQVWLPSIAVMLVREHAGSPEGLTLALKGGHNGEHHNHNDVGSFLIASDGVPVLVDAGRPTYTKHTFGPRRYDIWTMQSQWHNVPEVDGAGQPVGAGFGATVIDAGSDNGAMTLELASAYDAPRLRSLVRTARLDRGAGRVEITDQWRREGDLAIVEHLLVAGVVTLLSDGAYVRPLQNARPVRLRWNRRCTATAEIRRLDDPMLCSVWGDHLTRIRIDLAMCDSFDLTIERDDMIAEDDR